MNNHSFYFERLSVREYPGLVTKAKPLAHIYHNPILKPSFKNKTFKSHSPRNLSLKVLDLQLPTFPLPKIFQRYFLNTNKPIHHTKRPPRSISILPDLYINPPSHSP